MRSTSFLALVALVLPHVALADVVINEALPNPAGGDSGFEWVELYNNGSASVSLEGWSIESGTSSYTTRFTFPTGASLDPGQHLLVGDELVTADYNLSGSSLTLGNAGSNCDALRLLDDSGSPVDTLIYGPKNTDLWVDDDGDTDQFAGTPGSDVSLARVSDGVDSNDSGVDFSLASTPTPGGENNPIVPPDCDVGVQLVLNEFLADPEGSDAEGEWVELLNTSGGPVDLSGYTIDRAKSDWGTVFTFPDGASLADGDYLVVGNSAVPEADYLAQGAAGLDLGNATSNADGVRLADCEATAVDTVIYGSPNDDGLVDDSGGAASSLAPKPASGVALARAVDGADSNLSALDFALAETNTPGQANPLIVQPECVPAAGGLVINELLADPDGTDDHREWVELYNPAAIAVSVEGWGIEKLSGGEPTGIDYGVPAGVEVPAQGFLVLAGENAEVGDVFLPGFELGNASSNADAVVLWDCDGTRVDTVIYGPLNNGTDVDETYQLIPEDSGEVPDDGAPVPGSGVTLGRIETGVDSDVSAIDFAPMPVPTPGADNPVCEPGAGRVVINEAMTNPAGDDGGSEWIELYNPGDSAVDVGGWGLAMATQGDAINDVDVYLPIDLVIEAGAYYVVGGELVDEADFVADFSLGNGTGGDGVRLLDCAGLAIDTLVYGSNTDDGIPDDTGGVNEPVMAPDDGETVARRADGVDTDDVQDWFVDRFPTPGYSNYHDPTDGDDPVNSGCGGDEAPDGDAPSGCGGGAPSAANGDSTPPSCVTAPLPLGGLELLALVGAFWRRRRREHE